MCNHKETPNKHFSTGDEVGGGMRGSWLAFADGIFLFPLIVIYIQFCYVFLPRKFPHNFSDSNQTLGQCWHMVGSICGQMLSNDISPMLFCWSDRPSRQRLVRSWPIALKPTIHAYANVMPIVLFQVSHLTNVGPTWFQVTSLS